MNKRRIGYTAGLTRTQTIEFLGMLLDLGLACYDGVQTFLELLCELVDDLRSE